MLCYEVGSSVPDVHNTECRHLLQRPEVKGEWGKRGGLFSFGLAAAWTRASAASLLLEPSRSADPGPTNLRAASGVGAAPPKRSGNERRKGFPLFWFSTSIFFWTYVAFASPNRTRLRLFKIILFRSKMDQDITVI